MNKTMYYFNSWECGNLILPCEIVTVIMNKRCIMMSYERHRKLFQSTIETILRGNWYSNFNSDSYYCERPPFMDSAGKWVRLPFIHYAAKVERRGEWCLEYVDYSTRYCWIIA